MKTLGTFALLLVGAVGLGCGKADALSSSTASTGGTIGPATGSPDAKTSGDSGAACPTGTWMGMPWSLRAQTTATGGGSGSGGAGGSGGTAGDAAPPSCTSRPASDGSSNVSCVGTAQISGSTSSPILIFEDGSELDYDVARVPTLGLPALGSGRVSVEYGSRQVVDCSYCGSRSESWVKIRTLDGGQLLFAGSASDFGSGVDTSILGEVLGATPVAEPGCSYSTSRDCYSFERTEYSYVAPTTPPLQLLHGEVTRWRSPDGVAYEMMISSSADSAVRRDPNCLDGREIASESKYVVLRVID